MVTSGGVRQYDTGGGAGGGLDESAAEAAWPRLAVPNWLDPHPDAASFAETWEFSTTGDMTQGELETAGWTFLNCTGEVSGGVFWLTAASANPSYAYLTVSLSGDFDFIFSSGIAPQGYDDAGDSAASGFYNTGIFSAIDIGSNKRYSMVNWGRDSATLGSTVYYYNGTNTSVNSGGSEILRNSGDAMMRMSRVSGTLYRATLGYNQGALIRSDETSFASYGWASFSSASISNTFDRLAFSFYDSPSAGEMIGCRFIRRFQ